jgi:hypothetical protein
MRRQLGVGAGPYTDEQRAAGEFALLTFRHFRPRTGVVPVFADGQLARVGAPVRVILGRNDAHLIPDQPHIVEDKLDEIAHGG